ncbi:MAG: hypothetical protein IT210_16310 [Armatimonadetes bacterium]|nr:hypothetical protein [Armatimonadota bacterium]
MKVRKQKVWMSKAGIALPMMLVVMSSVFAFGMVFLQMSSHQIVQVRRKEDMAQALECAEAGVSASMASMAHEFKRSHRFDGLDTACLDADSESPRNLLAFGLPKLGRYEAAVVGYDVSADGYGRNITLRSTGWVDYDNDGHRDGDEPEKTVLYHVYFGLDRSKVFDYAYFVNNYGWMNGFNASTLIVNGDMRANGNFDFSGGTPTINGSVYASPNDKLIPAAPGLVNITPTQWTNAFYNSVASTRARQAYDPALHGARGSAQYEQWRELIYDKDGQNVNGRPAGAVIGDVNGTKSYGGTMLDPTPMEELPMPDLSDLNYYKDLSTNYVDGKQTFLDGTANSGYGQGAYVEVWDGTQYVRLSNNGVVNGSATLIGTSTKPIKIHGPVTVSEDCIIKGYVQGQGTIYTGRNVHIVGSVRYANPPDFKGSDPVAIDQANEKKSILALAARASIIMGNTKTFTNDYPLKYMTPPFTKARYDDDGNLIPAYNAKEKDQGNTMRYQSLLGDTYINSISESVSQIDAVLYTNFLGGGNIGTGGGGVEFNGSIISKDEAMVLFSTPFKMNYDNRIKERALNGQPLIDIQLPRTPNFRTLSWEEL